MPGPRVLFWYGISSFVCAGYGDGWKLGGAWGGVLRIHAPPDGGGLAGVSVCIIWVGLKVIGLLGLRRWWEIGRRLGRVFSVPTVSRWCRWGMCIRSILSFRLAGGLGEAGFLGGCAGVSRFRMSEK